MIYYDVVSCNVSALQPCLLAKSTMENHHYCCWNPLFTMIYVALNQLKSISFCRGKIGYYWCIINFYGFIIYLKYDFDVFFVQPSSTFRPTLTRFLSSPALARAWLPKMYKIIRISIGISPFGSFLKWIIHFRLGFSIINQPFWGCPIYGNNHL